ncbi:MULTISPECIES: hypothetical protein [Streptomyces]|uniref:hypothetical protein n=1 Tax=Streptomyces TaxID=1883 RepID=UPI002DD824CE|nr:MULTISPECIES: hypothetical protein [unclassified Streptomyces]WSE01203.1 hypothetical protein OG758_48160 [Streptomyces sp. NBC_01474]
MPANRVLPVTKQLRDGSWLSHIWASSGPARDGPVVVRVLAYRLEGRSAGGEIDDYRLVTTLLDARRYPARQLAAPDGLGPHGERPSVVGGLYRISMALEELDLGSGNGGADD